jgi:DNA phosphorothioation-dependent restriction protein DptH
MKSGSTTMARRRRCSIWTRVDVRLTGGERARLMGPTHPLRLLWRLQMARLTRAWLAAALAQGSARERLSPSIRDFLGRGLAPTNLPLVLLDAAAPSFATACVEQGALTPFWSLYVPQTTRDKQTLRAQTQRALGISHKTTPQADEIDPAVLARKLGHYLAQHPYLHTLTVNAFNPGNAGLIVDALLLVESERSRRYIDSPLRYELRLFTQSDRPDDVGEAVEDLTNPDRQVKAEADAFTVAGRNHLFPKLRFSRHQLDDFLQNPRRFEAHVSLLRDLFPVAATAVANAGGRSSYLHGLIQEQVTTFAGDEQHFYWQRQLTPRPTPELDEGPPVAALLASLLDKLGRREVAVVSGEPQPEQTAGLALDLPIAERSLLYEVHAVSDWVFTIDRYLGLEYFDSTPCPDGRCTCSTSPLPMPMPTPNGCC